jgi:hypothetical protein
MRNTTVLIPALGWSIGAVRQQVTDPHASVAARQAMFKSSNDPLLREAIHGLHLWA